MGRGRLRMLLAAFAAASALAACTPLPDDPGVTADSGAANPQANPQANPPAAAPVTRPVTAAKLVGATPAAVTAALGQPLLRHSEGPAEVWLYRSPVCGLTVFLFPGSDGSEHVAAAKPASGDVEPGSCMASLEHTTTS